MRGVASLYIFLLLFTPAFLVDVSEEIIAYACEDDTLVLECQDGEVVRIQRAVYGRFTVTICNKQGQTEGMNDQCFALKAMDIISERCDGRQSCKLKATNHVFGDPCPNTSKYAEVTYTCQKAPPTSPKPLPQKPETPRISEVQIPLYGSPPTPHIVSVRANGPRQVEVVWSQIPPESRVLTTIIFVKNLNSDQKPSAAYSDSDRRHVLRSLTPNTTYSVYIKSMNKHGSSMLSNTVTVSTPPEAMPTTTTTTTTTTTNLAKNTFISWNTKGKDGDSNSNIKKASRSTVSLPVKEVTFPTRARNKAISTPASTSTKTVEPAIIFVNNSGSGSPRGQMFCVARKVQGTLWPKTRPYEVAEEDCPDHLIGIATWECLTGGWVKEGPDYSNCVSPWLEVLQEDVQLSSLREGNTEDTAWKLSRVIEKEELFPGDLKRTALKILPQLNQGIRREPNESKYKYGERLRKLKKAITKTGSALLDESRSKSWSDLSLRDRRMSGSSLSLAIESSGFQQAAMMPPGSSETTVDKNIVMEVTAINVKKQIDNVLFPRPQYLVDSQWQHKTDSILIPADSIRAYSSKSKVNIVFTIYNNLQELIQPHWSRNNLQTNDPSGSRSEGSDEPKVFINTRIISASMDKVNDRKRLDKPVVFTLHHLQPNSNGVPICSFWDMDANDLSGRWSKDGCHVVNYNTTHTTCECDHLTNFAVLMDVSGIVLSEEHELALRVTTCVGCAVSIVCLLLSWITFMAFKNLQCDRNTIHKNLVLCLLVAEIIFLAGISETKIKLLCAIIAGLLHLFFLSAFAWMCLEGIQLYVMLVEVFELEKSRVIWYYIFGYGVPVIIVSISAGIEYDGYGTSRHCWLSTEDGLIWSFVGPALIVILINICMLSIAIYTMCKHSNMSATMKEQTKVSKFRIWVKGAWVLVILLGLTWLFGVLYLNQQSVAMAYLFTIFNSLQGLFIFIFHCYMNDKVQKEYKKVARRTSWLPDCIRVNYGGYNGVATSSPHASTGSGNYFSKLLGQGRRKKSEASTNSSMRPFINKDQHRLSANRSESGNRDSSTGPVSLNGYVYNPQFCSGASNPFTNNNGVIKASSKEPGALTPCYETVDGLVGDLSETVDCSIIDSEIVTEYCGHTMQVSQEQRRYSTGSEASEELHPMKAAEVDGISFLSATSSMKKSHQSIPKQLDTDSELDDDKHIPPNLDLERYIIPVRNKISFSTDANLDKQYNESETKNMFVNTKDKNIENYSGESKKDCEINEDNSLSRVCAANLQNYRDDCSENGIVPLKQNTPKILTSYIPKTPKNAPLSSTESYSVATCVNTSLPDLKPSNKPVDKNMLTVECSDELRRHSSGSEPPFSPFRFSPSNC